MGTDNPKVSAYVPQALKDRLKQFREERDISESQAVTIILTEYFQMPKVLGQSPETASVGGVTLARMEAIEKRLLDFATSVEHRLQQLEEEIREISKPSVVHQVTLEQTVSQSEQNGSLSSELQTIEVVVEKADEPPILNQELELGVAASEEQNNSLLDEPLVEPANHQGSENERLETSELLDDGVIPSEPASELPKLNTLSDEAGIETVKQVLTQEATTESETEEDSQNTNDDQQVSVQNETVDSSDGRPKLRLSSELPNDLLSQALSGKIMAKRLGYHPDSLSKVKNKNSDEAFIALSADRDPDGIAWKSVKKGKGYLPASELSNELQEKLLTWLKENFPEYSP